MASKSRQRNFLRVLRLPLAAALALLVVSCQPRSPVPAERLLPPPPTTSAAPETLTVCSFNIQFLGSSKTRDNAALAGLVKGYDVVVIQELVAPPYPGTFPDGTPFKPDPQAAAFFDAMKANGFDYWLSEEDTGTGDKIHVNSSSTEWFVTFYREAKLDRASDLPHGFLATDRSNNPDFERVPYSFSFRTDDRRCDFVLISVHLQPDAGPQARARRQHELAAINSWVTAHDSQEKDFIILGDMNIENSAELVQDMPAGFVSLNDECRPTNTNPHSPKPYDQVLYRPPFTTEMDTGFDMIVVDLVKAMTPLWKGPGTYPGEPYQHDRFRAVYSDHDPVVFRLSVPDRDDD